MSLLAGGEVRCLPCWPGCLELDAGRPDELWMSLIQQVIWQHAYLPCIKAVELEESYLTGDCEISAMDEPTHEVRLRQMELNECLNVELQVSPCCHVVQVDRRVAVNTSLADVRMHSGHHDAPSRVPKRSILLDASMVVPRLTTSPSPCKVGQNGHLTSSHGTCSVYALLLDCGEHLAVNEVFGGTDESSR